MVVLNIIALIFLVLVLTSFCKNRWLKAVVSAIFGIFICMQISSLYLSGSFCDYKFFVHFNFRDVWWGVTTMFQFEIWLLLFSLIATIAAIFYLSIYLRVSGKYRRLLMSVKLTFAAISLVFLIYAKNGIVDNLIKVYLIYSTEKSDNFDEIYSNIIKIATNSSNSVNITKKEDLTASAEGKNIVIISLESFDRAYFNDKNKEIIPNLRSLRQEWNYYRMFENGGSGWTVASLYTTLTGLPAYFIGHGNSVFEFSRKSKIISLIDILGKAGYETYHLSENADAGGTKDLLNTFGIHHILDKTMSGKYSENMKDFDLFTEAKNIFKDSSQTKPKMIYISTLATHIPNGMPDTRLFSLVKQHKNDLATAAMQTDYLVGDFINFLKENNYFENTIIYIFPDHAFMGKSDMLKTEEKTKLWFLTNADKKDLVIDTANFYQIDLPRNILSGAKVKNNAVFLGDFVNKKKSRFH